MCGKRCGGLVVGALMRERASLLSEPKTLCRWNERTRGIAVGKANHTMGVVSFAVSDHIGVLINKKTLVIIWIARLKSHSDCGLEALCEYYLRIRVINETS